MWNAGSNYYNGNNNWYGNDESTESPGVPLDIDIKSKVQMIAGYVIKDITTGYSKQYSGYGQANTIGWYTWYANLVPDSNGIFNSWLWVFTDSEFIPVIGTGNGNFPGWLLDSKYLIKLAYLRKMLLLKLDVESDTIISINDELLNDIEWNDRNASLQGLLKLIGSNGNFTLKDIDELIERIDN